MAEFYRYFDSTDEDERYYSADEFAEYFRQVLTNGIFNGGTTLQTTSSGADMTVDIADGFGWIHGYLYKVKNGMNLLVEPADAVLNRIDRVVIRWDKRDDFRYIKAFVIKGESSATPVAPALTRTDDVYELSLAQVFVAAGKSFLPANAVTDERFNTAVCGLVNSLIQVDTSEMEARFTVWFNEQQSKSFISAAEKAKPNGVATLDANGKVPSSQVFIPEMVASNVTVKDTANHFAGQNVETVMAEIGSAIVGTSGKLVADINAILDI